MKQNLFIIGEKSQSTLGASPYFAVDSKNLYYFNLSTCADKIKFALNPTVDDFTTTIPLSSLESVSLILKKTHGYMANKYYNLKVLVTLNNSTQYKVNLENFDKNMLADAFECLNSNGVKIIDKYNLLNGLKALDSNLYEYLKMSKEQFA